jgi:F0F1-type ATP synthase epsilon subunit
MATFLDTLSNRQDKEYYLKQGFTYKIDIDASLLILAANQQREQTFDKENIEEIISTNSKNLNEVFEKRNKKKKIGLILFLE